MYTFLRPYIPDLPTRDSIRRRGGLALYHSLDIRRLVAFVGSGVSAAYGRPSWTELVRILLRVTAETIRTEIERDLQDEARTRGAPFKLRTVRAMLHETCDILGVPEPRPERQRAGEADVTENHRLNTKYGDMIRKPEDFAQRAEIHAVSRLLDREPELSHVNVTSLLELCETMVREAGKPNALRHAIEWMFRRDQQILPRLYAAGLISARQDDTRPALWDLPPPQPPSDDQPSDQRDNQQIAALKRVLEDVYATLGIQDDDVTEDAKWLWKFSQSPERNPALEKFGYLKMAARTVDPEKDEDAIILNLREARNLIDDAEPEIGGEVTEDPLYELRETLGIRRFLTINYDSEFERFLDERLGFKTPDPHAEASSKRLRDGFGGFAEVSNATEDELGQLVAFAAVSNPSNVRVLHLHGQSAAPGSLILTEADYQRRYLGKIARKRAFHEALESLFIGNSVLFVGVGMNEADVLQPFRQFASTVRESTALRGPQHGQAFALLPFFSVGQASSRALELSQSYGVSTRFFGEVLMPELLAFVGALKTAVDARLNEDSGDQGAALDRAFQALVAAERRAGEDGIPMPGAGQPAAPEEVIRRALLFVAATPESDQKKRLAQLEADVLGFLYRLACAPEAASRPRDKTKRLVSLFFDRLNSDILARALCAELRALAERRHKWAEEWRTMPTARRAVFRNIAPEGYEDPLWSRHQITLRPVPDAPEDVMLANPIYQKLRKLALDQGLDERPGRRILRAAIKRGGGKGSALRTLIEDLKTSGQADRRLAASLFPRAAPPDGGSGGGDARHTSAPDLQYYDGAFITHSNFLTEYGTVTAAFYRFLRVAMLKGYGVADLPQTEGEVGQFDRVVPQGAVLNDAERTVLSVGSPRRQVAYERNGPDQYNPKESFDYEEREDEALLGGVDRVPLLRATLYRLARLAADSPSDKRWLVALTGVDRLCENGLPVSSTIENFFRTLTEPAFNDVPLDIVLLSGDTAFGVLGLEDGPAPAAGALADGAAAAASGALVDGAQAAADAPPVAAPGPWPTVGSTREDRFQGRPWRGANETGPDGGSSVLGLLSMAKMAAQDYPKLTDARAHCRVLDCWVTFLLRDLTDTSGERRSLSAIPDTDRLPRILESMDDAVRGDRIYRVLDVILSIRGRMERLDKTSVPSWAALKESLLRHLSLITIPVERDVLLSVPEVAQYLDCALEEADTQKGRAKEWIQERKCAFGALSASQAGDQAEDIWTWTRVRREALTQCLRELVDAGLVVPVEARNPLLRDPEADKRYGVHSVLRACVTRKMNLPLRDLAQRNLYDVSVHDILPRDLPTPGHPEFREVARLVAGLIDQSRRDLEPWIRWAGRESVVEEAQSEKVALIEAFDEEAFHANTRRLRACFSILHGVLSIGAIARLDRAETGEDDRDEPPFETYRGIIRALLNAATAISFIRTKGGARPRTGESVILPNAFADNAGLLDVDQLQNWSKAMHAIEQLREPLHLSEIVWLYNERALISFIQGRMFDSRSLFEMAREKATNPAIQVPLRENPTVRRIHLSRALVLLEGGHIDECRRELNVLVRESFRNNRETGDSYHLAQGYLGLCAHLEGRFDTAAKLYEKAIEVFEERPNLRAVANFSRLYADLLRRDNQPQRALEKIERAKIAASRQEHRDLLHHALISQARLLRREQDHRQAAALLRKAEDYARSMGSYKISADALRSLAALMLSEGETDFAGRLAIEAMAITSITGMRLRKIACVVLYGEVLMMRDQPLIARPILQQALNDAERCGYQLQASRAADLLHEVEIKLNAATGLSEGPRLETRPPGIRG